jgi:hypothetical protein
MSSLFSDALSKVTKVFAEGEAVIEATYTNLVKIFPGLAGTAEAEKSALKQQLSNAFAFSDTELAPRWADGVSMVESACDTLVMGATHGAAAVALPIINVGLSMGFNLMRAAIDHAEAEAKAKWALPAPTSNAMPSLGVAGQAAVAALTK